MLKEDTQSATQLMEWALSINTGADGKSRAVCDVVQRVFGPTAGVSLILWDPKQNRFARSASTIPGQPSGFDGRRARSAKGPTSRIIQGRATVRCPRVSQNSADESSMLAEFNIESYVGVPVVDGGSCIGALYLLYAQPELAPESEIALLSKLASAAAPMLHDAAIASAEHEQAEKLDEPVITPPPSVWDAIISDPIRGSALLDADGVVRVWSPTMARLWDADLDPTARLKNMLHPTHVEAIRGTIVTCNQSGRTEGFTNLVGGVRQLTLCRKLRERPDATERYWITTCHLDELHNPPENVLRVPTARSSLGKLEVLTPRELEVLALLGEGCGLHEIADRLCRARKTIDNHRTSLGLKLGRLSMPQLVALASRCGLRTDDIHANSQHLT